MTKSIQFLNARGVTGILLVALGALLLTSNFSYRWDWTEFWPALLILWGVIRLADSDTKNKFVSIAMIGLGSIWLLEAFNPRFYRSFSYFLGWDYLWPLALVALGGYFIVRNMKAKEFSEGGIAGEANDADRVSSLVLLAGNTIKVTSQSFKGGTATAILGGVELDFREADIGAGDSGASTAQLDVTSLLGGVDLYLPTHWAVSVKGTPILGSIEDQRKSPPLAGEGTKTLVIDGMAILGSIEIKQ